MLLENGHDLSHANHNRWNFLHYAIANGYKHFIGMVRESLNEPLLRRGDIYQRTVMHLATINAQLDIIQLLDSFGYDLYHDRDKFGKTPLHYAAELDYPKTLKFLLTKIGVNEKDRSQQTPLHLAVINDHMNVVCTLLNEKDVDINAVDNLNRTPLYLGVENARLKIVQHLIENNADITILPSDQRSLVTLAVINNDICMLKYLFSLPNFDKFLPDENKWTPVHYAAQLGYDSMMQTFYQEDPSSLTARDTKGQMPLHIAAIWNQLKIVEYYNETYKTLFEEVDVHKNTPLHLAVKRGNVRLVNYLINFTNSDVNAQNDLGIFFY